MTVSLRHRSAPQPAVDDGLPPVETLKHQPGDFTWSTTDEPHATRRKIILAKHPEIAQLFGPTPITFWVTAFLFAVQLTMAALLRDASWYVIVPLAYAIGGTINHTLQLSVHDLAHNLCWRSPAANKWTAIFANFVTGVPSCITFARYHMDHHQYQGVDGIDTDIPCSFEVTYFNNFFSKLVWIFCQPFCYALRPMLIKPKSMTLWEVANWIAQASFDAAVLYWLGGKALGYLLVGTFLGMGLHPNAGHFIAEHYELTKGIETYSYYGWSNFFNLNVGYHNEHHDFPRVAWSRLPQVKAMAPEFYDHLPCYDSYLKVFWTYLTDSSIGPFSRVKRQASDKTTSVMANQKECASTNPYRILCFTAAGLWGAWMVVGALSMCGVW